MFYNLIYESRVFQDPITRREYVTGFRPGDGSGLRYRRYLDGLPTPAHVLEEEKVRTKTYPALVAHLVK